MDLPMLVVESDLAVFRRENAGWEARGFSAIRVDTMQQAIKTLDGGAFLFIAINADSVNYLPLLKIMREMTPIPIFIVTSNFTIYAQVEAFYNGADAYAPLRNKNEENILPVLGLLHRYHERNNSHKKPTKIILHDDLLVFPRSRQVFRNDQEIKLTKIEFDLLCLLMENRGFVLEYEQILRNVWGDAYADSEKNMLWCQIRDLRKKLNHKRGMKNYIKNVREVGYTFNPI